MQTTTDEYLPVTTEQQTAITGLCAVMNDWAIKKGWNESEAEWSDRKRLMHRGEMIALMHSELSECLEFLRKKVECPNCGGHILRPNCNPGCSECTCGRVFNDPRYDDHVPEITGEAAELADILIRIFHYCGKYRIDLATALAKKHEYNTNRPFRHGKLS